ncbi:hypothetical protein [Oleiharenicola lentus]|uniref:hypothetical protein n=1 Tax=Oleiharenicola lentus TaxID=2508720 RepID=UPI003F663A3F
MAANLMGIFEKISELISQFDEMASPELAGAALNVSPFGFLNYVLPLDLAIAMFTLWVPFYLACTLYRVIKAHVPTVS